METFPNLYILLEQSRDARSYYDSLPIEIRRELEDGAVEVGTLRGLRDYAEHLRHGKD